MPATRRLSYFASAVVIAAAAACSGGNSSPTSPSSSPSPSTPAPGSPAPPSGGGSTATVTWTWNGSAWSPSGTPPACATPVTFILPVDINKVTAVLYPGQMRGGHYKAHGGFLFAPGTNSAITVTAPMSGYLYRGVRYIENGEIQYLFDIVNSCGVMHRLDHLLTLSSRFQALAETLPAPTSSSATTVFPGGILVTEGETIATAVGFRVTGNTSVDWGAYDLRQKNAASSDPAWLAAHPGEQAPYALCWLDHVAQSAQLRALPGGDGTAGKTSDYCR